MAAEFISQNCIKIKVTPKTYLLLLSIALISYILFQIHVLCYYEPKRSTKEYLIDTIGCRIYKMDPFHISAKKNYYKTNGTLEHCNQTDYFEVKGNRIFLNHTAVQNDFGNVSVNCLYKSILRNPYKYTRAIDWKIGFSRAKPLKFGQPIRSEYITIKCLSGKEFLFKHYAALVLLKPDVEERCNNNSKLLKSERLNVILLGIDSISRLNFIRHLNETYSYLRNTLGAFELKGYTKVADNTFPNMVPLLTGKFYSFYRLDEDLIRKYMDDFDFIWKDYSEVGYRTMISEDYPDIATFHYRKRGFKLVPTDYFLRPFTIAVENAPWRKKDGFFCFHSKTEIEYFDEYFLRFIKVMDHRPYLSILFQTRLTHDKLNYAGYMNEPTLGLLQKMHEIGAFNNSIVVFFSDHGMRFGKFRETYLGKIEERMPFLFLFLPRWFLKSHPGIAKNLEINQGRLTTPFDVHATLVDVLSLVSTRKVKSRKTLGISLFTEISARRTCEDANISPHYCTCHHHTAVSIGDSNVLEAAKVIISTINSWFDDTPDGKNCAKLELHRVMDARVSTPSMFLFEKPPELNASKRYFDYLSQSTEISLYYLITLSVLPSEAIFESTVRLYRGTFNVTSEVSRINRYNLQSNCISDFRLKKFCYCKIS